MGKDFIYIPYGFICLHVIKFLDVHDHKMLQQRIFKKARDEGLKVEM